MRGTGRKFTTQRRTPHPASVFTPTKGLLPPPPPPHARTQFRYPPKQGVFHFLPVTAVRGAPRVARGPEQRNRDDEENEIRGPHREERGHDQPVPKFFPA